MSHGVTVICNNFPLCWEFNEIVGMGLISFVRDVGGTNSDLNESIMKAGAAPFSLYILFLDPIKNTEIHGMNLDLSETYLR